MTETVRPYTIGIEEEYQLIEPSSGNLCSLPPPGPDNEPLQTEDGVLLKREFHTSAVEIDSGVCDSVPHAYEQLSRGRGSVQRWCREKGRAFIAAGTHPFSDWQQSAITDAGRYLELVDNLQDVGRGNLIFGMHVHVAVPDPERAVAIMYRARAFLPHLLAVSCSSPFWLGRETGLKSSRAAVFSRVPRTGIPPGFKKLYEYQDFITTLTKTGIIEDGTRVWWDLRLHPTFPTLEFRICDMMPKLDDVMVVAALSQAVVAKIGKLLEAGVDFPPVRRALVEENKWRAARHGVRAKLIDFTNQRERQPEEWVDDLLNFVDDVVDDLGCREHAEGLKRLLADGTSAERQRRAYTDSEGDLSVVLEMLQLETLEGTGEART